MDKTLFRGLVFLTVAGSGFAQTTGTSDKFEVRLLGGTTFGKAVIHSPAPNVGAEFAYRFSRVFAVMAGYQHIGADFCFDYDCAKSRQSGRINDEVILGTRFSFPSRSWITPHFMVGLGSVRYSSPSDNAAATAGAGIDVRLTPRFGITTEVRRVAPLVLEGHTFRSYGRTAAGVYFRF
jgi:hypothetical protein